MQIETHRYEIRPAGDHLGRESLQALVGTEVDCGTRGTATVLRWNCSIDADGDQIINVICSINEA